MKTITLKRHRHTSGFVGIGARLRLRMKQDKKIVLQEFILVATSHETLIKLTKRLRIPIAKGLCHGCQINPIGKTYAKPPTTTPH